MIFLWLEILIKKVLMAFLPILSKDGNKAQCVYYWTILAGLKAP